MDVKKVDSTIQGIDGAFRIEWQDLGTSKVLKIKNTMNQDLITLARSDDPIELFENAEKNLDKLKEAIKKTRELIYG